jgi:hypothetical protein
MFQMIKQAYDEDTLDCSAVFQWHKHFVQGRNGLGDDEHADWPRTVRNEQKTQEVRTLVHANSHQSSDKAAAATKVCLMT